MRLLKSSGFLLGFAGALLASGTASANCSLERVASLPAKIDNGRVFIPGTMDGHPVDYLVDLAAQTTLLISAANDFSIRPDNFGSLDKIATFGAPGPDQLVFQHLPLRVRGTSVNFGQPQEVAVLGIDFFARYDVEFDVQHGKVVLYRPTGCESANLAYWPGPHTVAEMVSNAGPHINVPPYTAFNYPHINIRVKVHGQDMVAALDSGYAQSSLSLAAAHSVGMTVGGEGMSETDPTIDLWDGHITPTWVGSVDSIALGEETASSAKIRFRSFLAPPGSGRASTGSNQRNARYNGDDMVLGADFLIAHRILLSQSQTKVYFSPAEGVEFLGGSPKSSQPPA